jgi:hypothetical protein
MSLFPCYIYQSQSISPIAEVNRILMEVNGLHREEKNSVAAACWRR